MTYFIIMSLGRLIYALLQVKEILDDLPAIEPDASQGTLSENRNIDDLFEDLLKDATTKGYTRAHATQPEIRDPDQAEEEPEDIQPEEEPEEDEPEASQDSQEEEEDAQVSVHNQYPTFFTTIHSLWYCTPIFGLYFIVHVQTKVNKLVRSTSHASRPST
jgi:hypothetical protein